MSSLERFKAEQMADIFQTVKKMRMQRAGMVETVVSFDTCYINLINFYVVWDTHHRFVICYVPPSSFLCISRLFLFFSVGAIRVPPQSSA